MPNSWEKVSWICSTHGEKVLKLAVAFGRWILLTSSSTVLR